MRINLWNGRAKSAGTVTSLDQSAERPAPPPEEELQATASAIPSMGGREIGPFLREAAHDAPEETAIVELGSWLGAGTAQLALGVADRGPDRALAIHCFDQWQAIPHEVRKAARISGFHLVEGQDTLPLVMATLASFPAPIHFHKGDLAAATWQGEPISVYVDDACKKPNLFFHALRTFGPFWIPGRTVVALMDFHYWKRVKSKSYRCQRDFIQQYGGHFEPIERDYFEGNSWAVFRYTKRIDFGSVKEPGPLHRLLAKI